MAKLSDKTTRQDERDTPPHIEKLAPLNAPPDLGQSVKRAAKSKSDVSWLFVILAGAVTLLLLTVIIGGNLLLWFNSDDKQPIVVATPTEASVPVTPSVTPTAEADARVSVLLAPLRATPNLDSNMLVTYPEDTLLRIIGRNEDSSWLQVEGPGGLVGWMQAEMLEVNIALDEVPVVVVEATPTPQASQTAVVIEEGPAVESVIVIDEEQPAPITAPAAVIEVPAGAIEASAPATEPSSGAIQPNLELPSTIEVAPIDVPEVLGLPEVELPTDLALPEIELPLAEGGLPNLGLPSLEQLPEIELPIGEGLPELPIGEGLPELPVLEGLPEGLPELPVGERLPELPVGEGLPELPVGEGLPELPIDEVLSEIEAELPTEIDLPILPPIKIEWP
jgi:hypothetical protein